MNTYEKELETMKGIAREAGVIMRKHFNDDLCADLKADNTHVTIADTSINTLVIEILKQSFPDDGVVGEEESTAEYGMGRKWVCDPIDGTAGYVNGVPTAMFSLALVVDGEPILGVALDPFLNNLFVGVKGQPSTCNDIPISVSKLGIKEGVIALTGSLRALSVATYFPRLINDKIRLSTYSGAVSKACLVARGKFAGFIELGAGNHDFAAVHVIVLGAGGMITARDGSPLDYGKKFQGAIISNGITHADLIEYCRIVN